MLSPVHLLLLLPRAFPKADLWLCPTMCTAIGPTNGPAGAHAVPGAFGFVAESARHLAAGSVDSDEGEL